MSRARRIAGDHRREAPVEASSGSHGRRWDAAIVIVIALAWMLFAASVTRGVPALAYDTFRDIAYAENILAGRLFDDPSLLGYRWWYPPGNPLLFAGLSQITGRPLVDLYASSLYWLNVLNPVLLYLLVRLVWRSRAAALIALGMAGIGSYWWLTHAAAPMPSVQGVALNLATLIVWHRARRGAWSWVVATGLLIGASAWHHAMCGMFLVAAIGLHGVLAAMWRRDDDPVGGRATTIAATLGAREPGVEATVPRALVACGIGLGLALPMLWHILTLPRLNPDPFRWFGPELHDPRFALHLHAPLVLPLGLIGLWRILRASPDTGWVVGYAAAGLAGQLAGYLGHDLHLPIPYTLPHEFQWHWQLALAIASPAGVFWCAERLAERKRDAAARRRRRAAAIAWIAVAAMAPGLVHLGRADYVIRLDAGWQTTLLTCRWIREHLPIDAVIAVHPDAGYYMNGLTGCKVVALPTGHMNPASDARRRHQDLETMLTTSDQDRFASVAAGYDVSHLLVISRTGNLEAVRALYARWSILEPVDLGDVEFLLYRVTGPAR